MDFSSAPREVPCTPCCGEIESVMRKSRAPIVSRSRTALAACLEVFCSTGESSRALGNRQNRREIDKTGHVQTLQLFHVQAGPEDLHWARGRVASYDGLFERAAGRGRFPVSRAVAKSSTGQGNRAGFVSRSRTALAACLEVFCGEANRKSSTGRGNRAA
jgi:hypothetical protein